MIRILLLSLLLCACGEEEKNDYTQADISNPLDYDDQLTLNLAPDEDGTYDLWIKVGHSEEFGYENVYLKYHVVAGRDTIVSEVQSFALMDGGGLWKGEKTNLGYEISASVQKLDLTSNKSYEIIFEQYSRDNPLKGINRLGAKIVKL